MSRKVRHTLMGFSGGAVLFLGLGVYLNRVTGFAALEHVGPLAMLVLIGATVGGLVGPLLGSLIRQRRGPDGDGRDGPA